MCELRQEIKQWAVVEAFCTDGAGEMTEIISVFSSNAENSDMAYVLMPLPKSKMLNGMCLHF